MLSYFYRLKASTENRAKCIRIFPESKQQREKKIKHFAHPEENGLSLYDSLCSHISGNFLINIKIKLIPCM